MMNTSPKKSVAKKKTPITVQYVFYEDHIATTVLDLFNSNAGE